MNSFWHTLNDVDTAQLLRRSILALAGLGLVGTLAELLIGHTDGTVQRIPFVMLGLVVLGFALILLRPTPGVVRLFRGLMVLALSRAVGMTYHYLGNLGF